jgi:uncharacterized protein YeaO (DUF488 family)
MKLKIKRVYEEPEPGGGKRVLVDRLWPRGLAKEQAEVDLWLKDVAPSNELRKWFAHDPAKWQTFKTRYRDELKHETEQMTALRQAIGKGPATLLYGGKDERHNHAVVLLELLKEQH